MQDFSTFFRLAVPRADDGVYFIQRGHNGSANIPVPVSYDELINYTARHNVADGLNTWFTPAQFVPGAAHRRGINVAATQTFVLDIDIKPAPTDGSAPRHHTSITDALASLTGLTANGVVPPPSFIVASGGGLHIYWCTNRVMSFDEHKARATSLCDLLDQHDPKLTTDAKLTKNAASLFRLPGGFNYKHTPAPMVELLAVAGLCDNTGIQYGPEAIAPGAAVAPATYTLPNGAVVAAQPAGTVRRIGVPAPILETAQDMFNGCAVMRWIYLNQADKNAISYDLWRTAIALLSYTQDGLNAAHAMSQGWPGYDPSKVQKQWDAEKDQYGVYAPITCGTLCGFLPFPVAEQRRLCGACPHFKPGRGTPYQAAKDAQTSRYMQANAGALVKPEGLRDAGAQAPGMVSSTTDPLDEIIIAQGDDTTVMNMKARAVALELHNRAVPMTQLDVRLPQAVFEPTSAVWFDQAAGIAKVILPNKDDPENPLTEKLSDCIFWPLRFVATRDPDGSPTRAVQGLIYKHEGGVPMGRLVQLPPASLITRPDGMAGALASVGMYIEGGVKARTALQFWINSALGQIGEAAVVANRDAFGWTPEDDGSFVYGDFLFSPGGGLALVSKTKRLLGASQTMGVLKGSVAGAQSVLTFVGKYGSDEMRFAVAAAVGAPFIKYAGTAGAFVNLWGTSGKGKTLTGSVISSLFGSGAQNGAVISTKDTLNARYSKLSAANSLPVVHEEATPLIESLAHPMDPRQMGEYLYAISEGAGKGRATRDGSLAAQHNWATLVFGTSNNSIWQKSRLGSEQRIAEVSRAFELNIADTAIQIGDVTRNNAAMHKLGRAAEASSGVAGLLLSRYYVEHHDALRDATSRLIEVIGQSDATTSAEQRTRRAVLAVAALGAHILEQTKLWSMPLADFYQVLNRVATKVSTANSRNRPDYTSVFSDVIQSLQSNTALIRNKSDKQPPLPGSVSLTTPRPFGKNAVAGLIVTPRNELKARIELCYVDQMAKVYIRKEVFEEELRRRGIDVHHYLETMQAQGYDVTVAPYPIHYGVSAMDRSIDNRNPMAAPATMCVIVWYMTTGPTDGGEPPMLTTIARR